MQTATVAALFGMECEVYMGEEDMERQALNVYRMNLLGAKVTGVKSGTRTLKDAVNEAMRDWTANVENTYHLIGSAMGPSPIPYHGERTFKKIIGEETKRQLEAMEHTLPGLCSCLCGGRSNAIGMFYDFIPNETVRLIGAEAAGHGVDTALHAATMAKGSKGIFHGMKSLFLQK